ncbi:hypothetical protein AKJ57_04285 [candidate division MSBL1 archaeon SCGC-AAA259A05]|uniref:Uncharacterized protein n=1 Tax=candidate division MSBL1 archaeon SCGC-AAA259A05 TaxID=1698259 RepID=A0A133U7U4_9EURY|nr:hypothetical protein AKJ57_04285 [candidate division MSBL1 archaeon SCGC-AAA259A05]
MLQLIYERGDKLDSMNYEDLLFFSKRALGFFDQRGLSALFSILSKNRDKLKDALNELYQKTSPSSNWLYIFGIPFSSMTPGNVMDELGEFEGDRKNLEKLEEITDSEKTPDYSSENPERFQITADLFRKISSFARSIEITIDDLHDLLLSKL